MGMSEWPGKPDKMAREGGKGVVNEQLFHLHMIVFNIFFHVFSSFKDDNGKSPLRKFNKVKKLRNKSDMSCLLSRGRFIKVILTFRV